MRLLSWISCRAFFLIAGFLIIGAVNASAQQPTAKTTAVKEFLGDSQQILAANPNGGSRMTLVIQDLVLADEDTLPAIMKLLPTANSEQKSALANGLAQAAKIVVLTNQSLATSIQQQVAALNDPAVNLAFLTSLGDVQLGAVGTGAAAPGGALGAPGGSFGGGGSGLQDIRSKTFATVPFTYSASTAGPASVTVISPSPSRSVSP